MAKDINIHLKAKGAQQVKAEMGEAGRAVEKVGDKTEQTGRKTRKASDRIVDSFKKLASPAVFLAIATAVAAAAGKIAKFFDTIKTRSDEAVREVQAIRAAYTDLFEALDAFDEKQRQAVTKTTNLLLQKAGVTQEIGLPVINAYTRQFKAMVGTGQLTQEQYTQGLTGMLGYAERHGGAATADLISIAAGWGMVRPEQQGELRRMVAAGAQSTGLTDAELIGALGRGMPTIKAMGWTPEQAIQSIALIATGEVGRKKASLPATTLQSLMAPQLANIEKLGIPEDVAQDPRKLLEYLKQRRGQMDQQAFTQMLTQIYGTEAAAGVYKLITTPGRGIAEVLKRAAGPEGIAAEQAEEAARQTTLEARDATTKARKRQIQLDITEQEAYMEDVREIGAEKQKLLQRTHEKRQYIDELLTFGTEAEKERAAYRLWVESLTPEEKEAISLEYQRAIDKKKFGIRFGPSIAPFTDFDLEWKWQQITPKGRWETLTGITPELTQPPEPEKVVSSIYHDNRNYSYMIFNPVQGFNKLDLGIGARAPSELA